MNPDETKNPGEEVETSTPEETPSTEGGEQTEEAAPEATPEETPASDISTPVVDERPAETEVPPSAPSSPDGDIQPEPEAEKPWVGSHTV